MNYYYIQFVQTRKVELVEYVQHHHDDIQAQLEIHQRLRAKCEVGTLTKGQCKKESQRHHQAGFRLLTRIEDAVVQLRADGCMQQSKQLELAYERLQNFNNKLRNFLYELPEKSNYTFRLREGVPA